MTHADWKERPLLVTGGAGFLGSHLVEALLSRGARVTVLDCVDRPWRLAHLDGRIRYLKRDLAETRWGVGVSSDDFEYVFHLAAFSHLAGAQDNPEDAFRQNVIGTTNMLRMAREWGLKKFVFTSAGGLYTDVPKYLPIDERHPIDPARGVYVMTKRLGELLCDEFRLQYEVPTLTFRLFNTYGPRQSPEFLIPSWIKQGMETGKVTVRNGRIRRDFSFVRDIVEALVKGAEADACGGPFNLGTGVEHSFEELAGKIGTLVGAEVECQHQPVFGPERQLCDSRVAQRMLNWQPRYSLDEGLRLTVQSLKEELVLTK